LSLNSLDDGASADARALVLVADDDPDILALVGLCLEHAGYRTVLAADGSQALSLARRHRPNLIVLDVDMPRMTGFEVTRRLREFAETCATPVILVTARQTKEDVLDGFAAGKTEASLRAVPLQARALDALEELAAADDSPLVFPGERGGYLDIHHFRPYQWRPAQSAAGISPLRRIYDLLHTFATFALVPASPPPTFPATWAPV
jgi:CheY-like chemotaxis protein